jgi:hypothetical protein
MIEISYQLFSRCLTTGLPRDSSVYEETSLFDENAYHHYEIVRERLVQLFEDASIQYLRTPFVGNQEEVILLSSLSFLVFLLIDRMYCQSL